MKDYRLIRFEPDTVNDIYPNCNRCFSDENGNVFAETPELVFVGTSEYRKSTFIRFPSSIDWSVSKTFLSDSL